MRLIKKKKSLIAIILIIIPVYNSCNKKQGSIDDNNVVLNPYSNIKWSTVLHIPSCSHEHGVAQSSLNYLVSLGIRHIAFSNYYPSKPYYPLCEYFDVPDGIIGSPNAEHHAISPFGTLHCNSLGSFYESGSPKGVTPIGMNGESWQNTFNCIIKRLQYEDGGGVIINHPHWSRWASASSRPSVKDICMMLDYDSRVLGIEFYNGTCNHAFEEQVGWDLDTWDTILKTGRKCWGFSVADHRDKEGVISGNNILLCNELDEHECLKAYREGRFYGSLKNTGLRFNDISFKDNLLSVQAEEADYMSFVIDGEYHRIEGCSGRVTIPDNATYVRVEAHNKSDSIFSNPIMLHYIHP